MRCNSKTNNAISTCKNNGGSHVDLPIDSESDVCGCCGSKDCTSFCEGCSQPICANCDIGQEGTSMCKNCVAKKEGEVDEILTKSLFGIDGADSEFDGDDIQLNINGESFVINNYWNFSIPELEKQILDLVNQSKKQ